LKVRKNSLYFKGKKEIRTEMMSFGTDFSFSVGHFLVGMD